MENKNILKNQEGWAIMETMIAIVIGLMMVAGASVLIRGAFSNWKLNTAEQNITLLRNGVQQLYSGQPDYTGLSNTIGKNADLFASTMLKGGNVKNTWNGDVTIGADSANSTLFTITSASVPKEACIKLSTFGSWSSVKVGSTTVTNVSTASNACGDVNSLTFTSE